MIYMNSSFKNPLTNRDVKYFSHTHKELLRNKVEGVPIPEGYKLTEKGQLRKVQPNKKLGRPAKKLFTSEFTVLGSDLGFTENDFTTDVEASNKFLSNGYNTLRSLVKSRKDYYAFILKLDLTKLKKRLEDRVESLKARLNKDVDTVKNQAHLTNKEKRKTTKDLKEEFNKQVKRSQKEYKEDVFNLRKNIKENLKNVLKGVKEEAKSSKELGYNTNILGRSKVEKEQESVFKDGKQNSYLNRIKSYLKNNLPKGKTYRVAYYYKPLGDEHFKKFYEIPDSFVVPSFSSSNGFSSWWNKSGLGKYFYYSGYNLVEGMRSKIKLDYYGSKEEADLHTLDIGDVLDNVKIVFIEGTNVVGKKVDQLFRDALDKHCFLQPIYEWATSLLEGKTSKSSVMRYKRIIKLVEQYIKQYNRGFPEEEIQKLCDDIRVNISVELPFQSGHVVNIVGNRDKIRSFKFRNTRLNHVEIDELTYQGSEEYVTQDKLKEIEAELVEKGIFYEIVMGKNGLSGVKTASKNYTVNCDYKQAVKEFENKYNLSCVVVDAIKFEDLACFIKEGVHYNTCVDFVQYSVIKETHDRGELKHIDQVKAYTQFKTCPEYVGFLGKVTDFRKCTSIEFAVSNVGLYRIKNIVTCGLVKEWNDKLFIFQNGGVYTSPELLFLVKNGVNFDVVEGCWGASSFDFDFTENMYKKNDDGVAYYSKYIGSCDRIDYSKKYYMRGTKEYFENMAFYKNENATITYFDDGIGCIEYPKNYVYFKGHITAFITAYQRLNILHQLLAMDINKVLRVFTDAIYYTEHNFVCRDTFVEKEIKVGNLGGDTYITGHFDENDEIATEPFVYNHHINLLNGEGGSGKTHSILTDKGYIKPLFVCPSWELANEKKSEYNIETTVLTRFLAGSEESHYFYRTYNTIVADEGSQYTEGQKQELINICKKYGMKLFICADIDYSTQDKNITVCFQTTCEAKDSTPISMTGFDNIVTFTKNFRCESKELLDIQHTLRKMIDNSYTVENKQAYIKKINSYILDWAKENNRIISLDELSKVYDINDYILVSKCRCNVHHDEDCNCDGKNFRFDYNKLFVGKFDMEKYTIKRKSKDCPRGRIIISAEKPPSSVLTHASTIHATQGKTLKTQKIFIDMRKLFQPQMIYTAISRAKRLEQIYIIETPSETMPPIEELDICIVNFGKHKGLSYKELYVQHFQYCEWIVSQSTFTDNKIVHYIKECKKNVY